MRYSVKPWLLATAALAVAILGTQIIVYYRNQAGASKVADLGLPDSPIDTYEKARLPKVTLSSQEITFLQARSACQYIWQESDRLEIEKKIITKVLQSIPPATLDTDTNNQPIPIPASELRVQYVDTQGHAFTPSNSTPTVNAQDCQIALPTIVPTLRPTTTPSIVPTPTSTPTASPSPSPTIKPTSTPTATPTASPTTSPSPTPTATPTAKPTNTPTATPTVKPTTTPTPTATSGGGSGCIPDNTLTFTYSDLPTDMQAAAKATIITYLPKIKDFLGNPLYSDQINIITSDDPKMTSFMYYTNNPATIVISSLIFKDITNPAVLVNFQSALVHELIHAWNRGFATLGNTLLEEGRAEAVTEHFLGNPFLTQDGVTSAQDEYGMPNYDQFNIRQEGASPILEADFIPYIAGSTIYGKLYYEKSDFFKAYQCALYTTAKKNWSHS